MEWEENIFSVENISWCYRFRLIQRFRKKTFLSSFESWLKAKCVCWIHHLMTQAFFFSEAERQKKLCFPLWMWIWLINSRLRQMFICFEFFLSFTWPIHTKNYAYKYLKLLKADHDGRSVANMTLVDIEKINILRNKSIFFQHEK